MNAQRTVGGKLATFLLPLITFPKNRCTEVLPRIYQANRIITVCRTVCEAFSERFWIEALMITPKV